MVTSQHQHEQLPDEIHACPACGGPAHLYRALVSPEEYEYFAECSARFGGCARSPYMIGKLTRAEAISAWEQAVIERLAALENK
jgi:hypothetical protein